MAIPPDRQPNHPVASFIPDLIGRFQIRRLLGEGAFGWVYEAFDPVLRRQVALKVAKPEQLATPTRQARFEQEAQAAAKLAHPHIVTVYDNGQDGEYHYIASAYVPGRSLAKVMRSGKEEDRFTVLKAVQLVRKLAEALAYAHNEGVVHRDVKPSNVLVRADGEPMLTDFGLAARADRDVALTQVGQFVGTPEYCAPEQWNRNAGPASDQYSLGCILYELLTGERPFAGTSVAHYVLLHTTVAVSSLRTHRAELPEDLERICLKCLEKEPRLRYADCQELAEDLRRHLERETAQARQGGNRGKPRHCQS